MSTPHPTVEQFRFAARVLRQGMRASARDTQSCLDGANLLEMQADALEQGAEKPPQIKGVKL